MGWICGKHKPAVVPDGQSCDKCKNGVVGRGDAPPTRLVSE